MPTINITLIGGPAAGRRLELTLPTTGEILIDEMDASPPFRIVRHRYAEQRIVGLRGIEMIVYAHQSVKCPLEELLRYYHANH